MKSIIKTLDDLELEAKSIFPLFKKWRNFKIESQQDQVERTALMNKGIEQVDQLRNAFLKGAGNDKVEREFRYFLITLGALNRLFKYASFPMSEEQLSEYIEKAKAFDKSQFAKEIQKEEDQIKIDQGKPKKLKTPARKLLQKIQLVPIIPRDLSNLSHTVVMRPDQVKVLGDFNADTKMFFSYVAYIFADHFLKTNQIENPIYECREELLEHAKQIEVFNNGGNKKILKPSKPYQKKNESWATYIDPSQIISHFNLSRDKYTLERVCDIALDAGKIEFAGEASIFYDPSKSNYDKIKFSPDHICKTITVESHRKIQSTGKIRYLIYLEFKSKLGLAFISNICNNRYITTFNDFAKWTPEERNVFWAIAWQDKLICYFNIFQLNDVADLEPIVDGVTNIILKRKALANVLDRLVGNKAIKGWAYKTDSKTGKDLTGQKTVFMIYKFKDKELGKVHKKQTKKIKLPLEIVDKIDQNYIDVT